MRILSSVRKIVQRGELRDARNVWLKPAWTVQIHSVSIWFSFFWFGNSCRILQIGTFGHLVLRRRCEEQLRRCKARWDRWGSGLGGVARNMRDQRWPNTRCARNHGIRCMSGALWRTCWCWEVFDMDSQILRRLSWAPLCAQLSCQCIQCLLGIDSFALVFLSMMNAKQLNPMWLNSIAQHFYVACPKILLL